MNLLLIVAGVAVPLFFGELAVRILDVPPRRMESLPIPNYRLSDNSLIGYEYIPDYRPTDEPFDVSHRGFQTNDDGIRDYDYETTKPEGIYRIIVIGDSTDLA